VEKYKDKEWLEKKYWNEGLSIVQIAKLCNMSCGAIWGILKRYNMPIRSCSDAALLFQKKKTGNIKHWDKNWLKEKYLKEKLNATQISKECGVNRRTIDKWLKKFNIFTRSQNETVHLTKVNHCNLSQKAIEWINGELLGDGCLQPTSLYSAGFRYSSKYKEYINYISDTLKSFGIERSGRIIKYYNKRQDTYCYKYNSRSYKELMPIYKEWYPEGKKIIPKNIKLNPITLRQHYIGDGSLIHQNGNMRIILCTCGFSILDVNWFVEKLNNLGFRAMRQPSRNIIHISTYSVIDFLNYIGECPVNCYKYKFQY